MLGGSVTQIGQDGSGASSSRRTLCLDVELVAGRIRGASAWRDGAPFWKGRRRHQHMVARAQLTHSVTECNMRSGEALDWQAIGVAISTATLPPQCDPRTIAERHRHAVGPRIRRWLV